MAPEKKVFLFNEQLFIGRLLCYWYCDQCKEFRSSCLQASAFIIQNYITSGFCRPNVRITFYLFRFLELKAVGVNTHSAY